MRRRWCLLFAVGIWLAALSGCSAPHPVGGYESFYEPGYPYYPYYPAPYFYDYYWPYPIVPREIHHPHRPPAGGGHHHPHIGGHRRHHHPHIGGGHRHHQPKPAPRVKRTRQPRSPALKHYNGSPAPKPAPQRQRPPERQFRPHSDRHDHDGRADHHRGCRGGDC